MHAGAGGRGGAGEERLSSGYIWKWALPVFFQLFPDHSLLFFPHFFFKIFFFDVHF